MMTIKAADVWNMMSDEQRTVAIAINQAMFALRALPKTRETELCKTKLDEAAHWLCHGMGM